MDILTEKEAAAILKVNPATLRRWVVAGKIQLLRVGRGRRYRRADILGLVKEVCDER